MHVMYYVLDVYYGFEYDYGHKFFHIDIKEDNKKPIFVSKNAKNRHRIIAQKSREGDF